MTTYTTDIDPNISVFDLYKTLNFFGATLISLNEQPNLPLPSITIKITPDNLTRLKTQI
jgi:hypothetical protein